jgi:crotonobetainyl-CoA:carnitine CoA-transferase CaiB-like acyl-CoA transferase
MAARLPLSDVKVLDFFWVLAGPGVTRPMADYGATVVRIESTQRVDPTRTVGPFKDNNTNPEYSALFGNNNAGKLSLSLDLSKPAAREVVLDLVRWADIVTESFSPKAMRAWGFDYESLRTVKPDIIMISSCLMGQTGPLARFAGFGNLAAALCGFYNLVGWPDRTPSGPFSAYTDYIAPRFGLAAVMAALIHRKQTGEGQYIDQAQAESALQFLTLPIIDTVGSGRKYSPTGNDDLLHAPHGVYPARGQKAGEAPRQDRWVAIACRTDDQWRALCAAIGQPQLAADRRFNSFAARHESRAELDRIIGEWTRERTPDETERVLQASGVPAHTVQTTFDANSDPQLRHREHFVRVNHAAAGETLVENSRFKLSRTPAVVNRSAPALGQHSQYVFEQILGYDESRISELVAGGVLG